MGRIISRLIWGLAVSLVTFNTGFSQSATGYTEYNWFFGNSPYSISFNKGVPHDPYLDSAMFTPFGLAGNGTATDQVTGALLFYSDGSTVYDASHRAMPSAAGGPAVTANQGIAICPVPGSNDEYFIFAMDARTSGRAAHSRSRCRFSSRCIESWEIW